MLVATHWRDEAAMCEKCVEIDEKIEHYRALLSRVTDQLASEGIAQLIADLLAEKVALHPEQDE
ncbi:hypothetical protein [Bradyrhizobium sp. Leo170]|uniref:hypothetical protein n=1 Tax=Bradyrhizobium sp. Leo170 TaxID=1571199 RepID=UPI00102E5E3C|nr:hypothetical protein [Bradyrhizobium sp. Leo170]TAI66576.1 hypothetical protein CWO89_07225 [Bradyrhizobium sp. Leo170]